MTPREVIAEIRAEIAGWPGTRGWYGCAAMIAFAGGFWLSVIAGPGIFWRVDYPEPRAPGIVTVTVPAPTTATTPTTSVPVAGEPAGTGRRSSPVSSRRPSGATTTKVPAESKGRASVMQSPPPGPSITTTTTTTTTSPTTTTTKPPGDDDEGDGEDDR